MRNQTWARNAASIALCLFLAGCAHTAKQETASPAALTEKITRAVYAGDMEATVADFDDDLKKEVGRTGIGSLSDTLRKLGEIKTISQRNADPDKGRYDYDAAFDHGAMTIQLRLDPSGKVGAYRVVPTR